VHARALTLALLLAGCDATTTQTVDLSGAGSGLAFVVLGTDEAWSVAQGPFGLDDGQLTFGSRPQLVVQPGQHAVVVIVPEHALAIPGFDPAWAPQVQMQVAGQRQVEVLSGAYLQAYLELPGDSTLISVGPESLAARETELRRTLGLRVPFDPEHCRPAAEASLQAWGAAQGPLQDLRDRVDIDLRDVAVVDMDHLVAHSDSAIFALTRDASLTAADLTQGPPHRVLSAQSILPNARTAKVQDIAVDPRPGAQRTVVVVVYDQSLHQGHVLVAQHTQDGLHNVRTATTIGDSALWAVAFGSDGAWLATGDEGLTLMGHADTSQVRQGPRAVPQGVGLRRVASTDDAAWPWVMTGNKVINEFEAAQQQWRIQPVGADLGGDILFGGLVATGAQSTLHMWAGGRSGLLFERRPGEAWAHRTLAMPPRFAACTQQVGVPRPALPLEIKDLAIADGYLYAAVHSCNALVQVRLSDHCTSLALLAEQEVRADSELAVGLDVREGWIVAVGAEGRIFEKRTR